MKLLFVVIRRHGAGWKAGRPLEEQTEWDAHATFMDGLYAGGFVALAGPMGDDEALLVVRASSAMEIEERLSHDPWTQTGLLATTRIEPWTLRLGSI